MGHCVENLPKRNNSYMCKYIIFARGLNSREQEIGRFDKFIVNYDCFKKVCEFSESSWQYIFIFIIDYIFLFYHRKVVLL